MPNLSTQKGACDLGCLGCESSCIGCESSCLYIYVYIYNNINKHIILYKFLLMRDFQWAFCILNLRRLLIGLHIIG